MPKWNHRKRRELVHIGYCIQPRQWEFCVFNLVVLLWVPATVFQYKYKLFAVDYSWVMLIFSSFIFLNSLVHLSRINGTSHQLKPLYLQPSKSSFCIFSLAFSNCGDQIIGGGSDGCLYIYDLVMGKRTFRCPVNVNISAIATIYFLSALNSMWWHLLNFSLFFSYFPFLFLQFEIDALDVNAVGFIDETSNIIFSGSDNGIIKVWND